MATSIPGAIANLVTALKAAPTLAAVTIYDGPPVKATGRKDYICVGYTPDTDTIAFQRSWAAIGARRQEEDYEIPCSALVWSGGTNMTVRRNLAFDLLDAVAAVLAADPTLGGVLRLAAINGPGSLGQTQTSAGAAADLRFVVECQTRINQ